jgi:outer membrane protein TolC
MKHGVTVRVAEAARILTAGRLDAPPPAASATPNRWPRMLWDWKDTQTFPRTWNCSDLNQFAGIVDQTRRVDLAGCCVDGREKFLVAGRGAMRIRASQRLALCVALLLGGAFDPTRVCSAIEPSRPAVEAVPLPAPRSPPPAEPLPGPRPPGEALPNSGRPSPTLTYPRASVPVAVPVPQPNTRQLPIALATALRLADARPIIIAAAQASVQVATRQLEQARVLWLPDINIGASYYRHDGGVQGSSGDSFVNARNQFMAGGGPYAIVSTGDAYFAPLAARQVLRSRTLDVQASRNDALLRVAEAYFSVQQMRGRVIGADDSVAKARALVAQVQALAAGLVPANETRRVRTLLASLEQSAAAARGDWGVASAQLTRALRLDPTAFVAPIEAPHLQVTLIRSDYSVDDLVVVGLTSRPELASQQALVQAALVRLRQERMRPLMPSVLLVGDAVPTAPANLLMGGVFASSNNGQSQPTTGRNDVAIELVWALNNMGFGTRATIRERQAEQQQELIQLFQIQDTVAADVAGAHAQMESSAVRVREAEIGVQQAQESFAGNLKGLSETTRFGDLLVLVNRPQEVVAALQQLAAAYDNYFISVNEYNRNQFRLYHAAGYPAGMLAYESALGPSPPVDTRRPPQMAPVCPPNTLPTIR